MFNLLSPLIVSAGLLAVAIILYLGFALLKRILFDGAPKNKMHCWTRRVFWFAIIPLLIFYALILGSGLAKLSNTGSAKVAGTTVEQKFQSIAKIVSDSHKGLLTVAYLNVRDQPGFLVLLESSATSSADAATQSKNAQEYANALATLLRLAATNVLPTEPSIQYVVIETVANGEIHPSLAKADDLKALPSDAPNQAWLAKLQMPQSQQDSSGAPPSP